jgi:hypothetical protein
MRLSGQNFEEKTIDMAHGSARVLLASIYIISFLCYTRMPIPCPAHKEGNSMLKFREKIKQAITIRYIEVRLG